MKRKIIKINEEDQKPIAKIKAFLKKFFLISASIIVVIALIYITIIISIFILGIVVIAGLMAYLYFKFGSNRFRAD